MNLRTLTAKDLRRAADIRERIDTLEQELNQLLGGAEAKAPAAAAPTTGKRRLSATGKARIAAAAKARWAAFRKSKGTDEGKTASAKPVQKRKFSPAARARLAASARARWAKAKAAGKGTL